MCSSAPMDEGEEEEKRVDRVKRKKRRNDEVHEQILVSHIR